MHILLIHQAFAAIDEPGGTRHHEMALYLADKGHKVTIITSPISYLTGKPVLSESTNEEHESIQIIRPKVYQALHQSFFHRILNFISFMFSSFAVGLKVEDVDLVWGTSPPIFQGLPAWGIARLNKVPFLFEVRDLWPAFAVAVGVLKNKLLIWASERLENFLYRHADTIVVNSPGFIDHVKSRCGRKIHLVPNGVDVRMFQPDDDEGDFRRVHQLENKFIVLYAGAHGVSNDLGVLLKAADLLKEIDNIIFILMGDGKEKANLQAQAEELALSNVKFIPPVPKTSISYVLAASDVCVAILKPLEMYRTVYPNKVFDYMASGRPVILAIDGVIREVVETAQSGLFVDPGDPQELADAVRDLYNHASKRKTMGRNGRKYVESHFNRIDLAEGLLKILNEMVDTGK